MNKMSFKNISQMSFTKTELRSASVSIGVKVKIKGVWIGNTLQIRLQKMDEKHYKQLLKILCNT